MLIDRTSISIELGFFAWAMREFTTMCESVQQSGWVGRVRQMQTHRTSISIELVMLKDEPASKSS